MDLIEHIDALLPQTQCGKCGHPGCRPYAEGIAAGEPINKCPPGGAETIEALSRLLITPAIPLDPQRGNPSAVVAYIREAECIGCTKCIQACPVDAIVGAAKFMHTVLVDECTGCDLCIAPCPVDCIDLVPVPIGYLTLLGSTAPDAQTRQARQARRDLARQRFRDRSRRLAQAAQKRQAARKATTTDPITDPVSTAADDRILKQAKVAVAMSRAQFNKSIRAFGSPPTAEQHARLSELHVDVEAAEQRLTRLQSTDAKEQCGT